MFTQIFDTHSHYTDSAFDEDRDQVLDALPKEGIVHAVLAGTTLEDSAAGIALTRRYDYLYAAVGIHPETAGQQPADYLAQLERMAADPRSGWTITMRAMTGMYRSGCSGSSWIWRNSWICRSSSTPGTAPRTM